jgi:AmmeMemoRadiSam system protein A
MKQMPPDAPPLNFSSITPSDKKILLEVARRSLELCVHKRESLNELPNAEGLNRPGGAFVTLRIRRRLRGCIGQLVSSEPLIRVVAYCAHSAALEDPRFQPVRAEELPEIEIELSILSPLVTVVPDQIVAGKHGISVRQGNRRGVLLPQVAVQFHWDAKKFLEETCVKAELERDAWKDPAVQIQVFTAEVFGEVDFRAGRSDQPDLPLKEKPRYSSST